MSKVQIGLKVNCKKILEFVIKNNTDSKSKAETENFSIKQFIELNKELTKFLDDNSNENFDLDPLFEVIQYMQQNLKSSKFKFICLFEFITKSRIFGDRFDKLTKDQIDLLFSSLQIEINNYKQDSEIMNKLDYLIDILLQYSLYDSALNTTISAIQNFFENGLEKINKKFNSKSIYYNLIENKEFNEEKIPQLIQIYKSLIITNRITKETSKQFENLIQYESSNGSLTIAEKHYKQVFESMFEAFMKTFNCDSRKICLSVVSNLIKSFNSTGIAKSIEFQMYLICELIKFCKILVDSKENLSDDVLKEYNRFMYNYSYYQIFNQNELSNSYLIKHLLQLIVLFLKIKTNDFYHIEYLLSANRLFNLANCQNDCVLILDELVRIIHSKQNVFRLDETNSAFIEKVTPFKNVINSLQPVLFNKILCESIERKIYDKNVAILIARLVDLTVYPIEKNDIKRLSNLIGFISQDEVFNSFQADTCNFNNEPANMFFNFFQKLSKAITARPELVTQLQDNLIKLLDKIKERNEYYSLFLDQFRGCLINYYIVKCLSDAIVNEKNYLNKPVMNKLIEIWIEIKDQNLAQETCSSANYFFQYTAINHHSELANFSTKMFEYYLNEKSDNFGTFIFIINQIIPIKQSELTKNDLSHKIHDKILKSNVDFIMSSMHTYNTIIKYYPQFFVERQEDNKSIRLFDLVNVCFEYKDLKPEMFAMFIFMFNNVTELVRNNSKFYSNDFFTNRNILIRFLEFAPKDSSAPQILRQSTIIETINSYYRMISIHQSDKLDEIMFDLINLIKSTNQPKEFKLIFQTMKDISVDNNRIDLLKNNRNFFDLYKTELSEIISSIIDVSEERSLKGVDIKLDKNIKNVKKIEEKQIKTDHQITKFDIRLTKEENSARELKKDINGINERLDEFGNVIIEQDNKIEEVNSKTLANVPKWGKQISLSLKKDWILIAKRLNYDEKDIKAWMTQADPCMFMLQEWFLTNKTSDAIIGLVKALKSLNQTECVKIIETDLSAVESDSNLNEKGLEIQLNENPTDIFVSFEWSSLDKANLLKKYLIEENFSNIWFDDGKMGGGVTRNKRIDIGLRKCRVLVCLITKEATKDEACLNQINLCVQLSKPIIPLLLDSTLKWPPAGSLGPILSEYLFIRFFQRSKEVTNDERYWPVEKFNELIMQLKALVPLHSINRPLSSKLNNMPQVFISYQWDKQKEIIMLFEKFKKLNINCWLDIYQMGGGDSLYDKIDKGIRNCLVLVSCVTKKYSLSANCKKEVALADSISKPIVPILLEKMPYPPSGPMSPTLSVLKYIDFTNQLDDNEIWNGKSFNTLLNVLRKNLDKKNNEIKTDLKSKTCVLI